MRKWFQAFGSHSGLPLVPDTDLVDRPSAFADHALIVPRGFTIADILETLADILRAELPTPAWATVARDWS